MCIYLCVEHYFVYLLLCIYLCVFTYVYLLMCIYLCVSTYVYLLMCIYLCVFTYVYLLMCIHLCVGTYVYVLNISMEDGLRMERRRSPSESRESLRQVGRAQGEVRKPKCQRGHY